MDKITLTNEEINLKKLLENIACGAFPKIIRNSIDNKKIILADYKGLSKHLGVTKEQLFEMLDHISRHDFLEGGMPMLEAQLLDLIAGALQSPTHRVGLRILFEEFYGIKLPRGPLEMDEQIRKETKRVEWYYRITHNFDEPFLKTLNGEHIIVRQEKLMEMCNNYLPAIALRLFYKRDLIKIKARYIVQDEKPYFGTVLFGDFFFFDQQMYIITNNEKLKSFNDIRAAERLWSYANDSIASKYYSQDRNEDFVDEESGEIVSGKAYNAEDQSKVRFSTSKLYVVPVLFAGTQTNIRSKNTNEYLFTGDAVTVKSIKSREQHTLGLSVSTYSEQYALIADNHEMPLPPIGECEYYKAGSMFYNLDMQMHTNNVFSCCSSFAQGRSHKIQRLQIKHSPCYAHEEWEWETMKTLGI